MNINFSDPVLLACQEEFNKLDPETRIVMSQYDFADQTEIKDVEAWMKFLKEPKVKETLNTELNLYVETQKRKLIQRATDNDKSVGTAQMINALARVTDSATDKIGTLMIYSYVPLNAREMNAENVQAETEDIFNKEGIIDVETKEVPTNTFSTNTDAFVNKFNELHPETNS